MLKITASEIGYLAIDLSRKIMMVSDFPDRTEITHSTIAEIDWLLDVLNKLLERMLVIRSRALELRRATDGGIPPLPKNSASDKPASDKPGSA